MSRFSQFAGTSMSNVFAESPGAMVSSISLVATERYFSGTWLGGLGPSPE